ncbi:D-alanyl-D-alanine carboxypeptidase/D-alanyl-D-alanine endopeptidase [Kitasatospora kifunensis]|uniref:D-alanyl-D-alanine carboxypeptidase/D-alanyl-D-alanine-endopeptidase (Penicillin-binding protein 4) n=1 Tax=Kitasatospora kifunensis TaxID=58351 RepID=A0A7W7R2F9_KITKI|nr:D-alanyl-D-alanine carboxypeptidase/D-alanyl-D-alanine-endopeptidase [Kitasatospora kifunensis]MBB4924167.1 D-alanyl-D-alanine carboxypeptidase/D-alanyl-D-alanine-endopeptidase (penicillin-binding protein 4) [Kitasatospora kifunensis]
MSVVAGAAGLVLLVAGGSVGPRAYAQAPASGPASPPAAPPAAAPVLTPAVTTGGEGLPTTAGLQAALGQLTSDKALGTLTFAIADGGSGKLLLGSGENTPSTPASTTKLATTVAALSLLPPDTRLTTKVVHGATPADIVLVGGGDPTLTGLPVDQIRISGAPVDPDSAPASLIDLANRTAAALKAAGVTTVHLTYDTSLYTGPAAHKFNDGTNIGPMSSLMIDEGRQDATDQVSDAPVRVADPAAQAVAKFTDLLGAQGVKVDGKPAQGQAPANAAQIAQVQSPVLPRLVERLLTNSDNTLAEAVARQVAVAQHQPVSYDGAAQAVTQTLAGLGIPMAGVSLNDGSGLNIHNTIPPVVLADLLALAASPDHPQLRPVLTGLPIAGLTGTLDKRFVAAQGSADGAGVVRAKTGSLSGVNTLAGTVVDADGRLLSFALMTKTPADAGSARAAMDRIVAKLVSCGCK